MVTWWSCTISLSSPPTLALFSTVLVHRIAIFLLFLLPLRDEPLDNRLPHDVVDALRFAQLLLQASDFALQFCNLRL